MLDALAKLINAGVQCLLTADCPLSPRLREATETTLQCTVIYLVHSDTATSNAVLYSVLKLSPIITPAGQLKLAYTVYRLDEFAEALDHALDSGINSKIVLRMPECSINLQ